MADNQTSSATCFFGPWNKGEIKAFLERNLDEERARVLEGFERCMKHDGEQVDCVLYRRTHVANGACWACSASIVYALVLSYIQLKICDFLCGHLYE